MKPHTKCVLAAVLVLHNCRLIQLQTNIQLFIFTSLIYVTLYTYVENRRQYTSANVVFFNWRIEKNLLRISAYVRLFI